MVVAATALPADDLTGVFDPGVPDVQGKMAPALALVDRALGGPSRDYPKVYQANSRHIICCLIYAAGESLLLRACSYIQLLALTRWYETGLWSWLQRMSLTV